MRRVSGGGATAAAAATPGAAPPTTPSAPPMIVDVSEFWSPRRANRGPGHAGESPSGAARGPGPSALVLDALGSMDSLGGGRPGSISGAPMLSGQGSGVRREVTFETPRRLAAAAPAASDPAVAAAAVAAAAVHVSTTTRRSRTGAPPPHWIPPNEDSEDGTPRQLEQDHDTNRPQPLLPASAAPAAAAATGGSAAQHTSLAQAAVKAGLLRGGSGGGSAAEPSGPTAPAAGHASGDELVEEEGADDLAAMPPRATHAQRRSKSGSGANHRQRGSGGGSSGTHAVGPRHRSGGGITERGASERGSGSAGAGAGGVPRGVTFSGVAELDCQPDVPLRWGPDEQDRAYEPSRSRQSFANWLDTSSPPRSGASRSPSPAPSELGSPTRLPRDQMHLARRLVSRGRMGSLGWLPRSSLDASGSEDSAQSGGGGARGGSADSSPLSSASHPSRRGSLHRVSADSPPALERSVASGAAAAGTPDCDGPRKLAAPAPCSAPARPAMAVSPFAQSSSAQCGAGFLPELRPLRTSTSTPDAGGSGGGCVSGSGGGVSGGVGGDVVSGFACAMAQAQIATGMGSPARKALHRRRTSRRVRRARSLTRSHSSSGSSDSSSGAGCKRGATDGGGGVPPPPPACGSCDDDSDGGDVVDMPRADDLAPFLAVASGEHVLGTSSGSSSSLIRLRLGSALGTGGREHSLMHMLRGVVIAGGSVSRSNAASSAGSPATRASSRAGSAVKPHTGGATGGDKEAGGTPSSTRLSPGEGDVAGAGTREAAAAASPPPPPMQAQPPQSDGSPVDLQRAAAAARAGAGGPSTESPDSPDVTFAMPRRLARTAAQSLTQPPTPQDATVGRAAGGAA
eukprot:131448-Chlamydomonas_euryale.AAC.1